MPLSLTASTAPAEPELAVEDTDSIPPLDELKVNLSLQTDVMSADSALTSDSAGTLCHHLVISSLVLGMCTL